MSLEIHEAAAQFATAPRSASWPEVEQKLRAVHGGSPQRLQKALHFLGMAEEACKELASLGHSFSLSEVSSAPTQEWPKMLYRGAAGESRVFASALELSQAGGGWRETPVPGALPPPAQGEINLGHG